MFQAFYSNHTEKLVAQLVAQTQAERHISAFGALAPIHVVVPNPHIETYLKIELARRTGIFANFEFCNAHDFFDESLRAHDPNMRLLDRRTLRGLILEALYDTQWLMSTVDLATVLGYIGQEQDEGEPRNTREHIERRRVQLADQLATLFESYTRVRPGMLWSWAHGAHWFEDLNACETEVWQRLIWMRIFEPELGLMHEYDRIHGVRHVVWHELPAVIESGEVALPSITHLFLPPGAGESAYRVWKAVAQSVVVFSYGLNPCREFWEEMQFGRQDELLSAQFSSATVGFGGVDYAGDDSFWSDANAPIPLRLWGFARAQHLRASHNIMGGDHHELYVSLADDDGVDAREHMTLLERLREDVLTFHRPVACEMSAALDDSVRVLAAPSVKREVEVIANEIWALMQKNQRARALDPHGVEPLRFHDIAVLIAPAQRELYQTHVRAVFPNTHHIPFNMVDMPATSYSRAVESVELMLAMPFGQFRRQELLRLLTHPNVMGRFPNLDAQEWLLWCDELKILHGADRRDHADTYIDGELFHWDQGLKRLVLGAFMTGKMSGDRRAYASGAHAYLPREYGQGSLTSASRLVLMARSLIEDARFCRTARMPLASWAEFMCRMISTYVVPMESDDEMILQKTRHQVAALADHAFSDRLVSYRVAYELARDACAELEVRRGQFLLDGVVVSTIAPERPIPFKVIFVAGLGEGCFPEGVSRRPEDLRVVTAADGSLVHKPETLPDVTEREEQKTAFFDALVCARDVFVMSYVSRDVRTGDGLGPSPVIEELLYTIEQDYVQHLLGEDEESMRARVREVLVTSHELRRSHPRYFPDLFEGTQESMVHDKEHDKEHARALTPSEQPEAKHEARARALRRSLGAHCVRKESAYPHMQNVRQAKEASVHVPLMDCLGILPLPQSSAESASNEPFMLRVSTYDIRSFLECPLQGSARFLLKFRDEDEQDILLQDSELFETGQLASGMLLREVFLEKLAREHHQGKAGVDFGTIYDERAHYFELEGLVPTGPFYKAARNRHLRTLSMWQENLPLFGLGSAPLLQVHRFGRAVEQELVDIPREPIALDLSVDQETGPRRIRVEISGRTESMLPGWPGTLISHQIKQVHTLSRRYFVRGFMDHVYLAAIGVEHSRPWTVFINPGEEALSYKHKNCVRQFEPMSRREATDYLGDVLTDMLSQVHAYYMPIEAVFAHHEREEPLEVSLAHVRANAWNKNSSDYGPIRDARRFDAPKDPEHIARRRFGPILDRMLPPGSKKKS